MAIAIVDKKGNTYPKNIQYLIFFTDGAYGINGKGFVLNNWITGLSINTISHILKDICDKTIVNDENISVNGNIINLTKITIGEFMDILAQNDIEKFSDNKIHTIFY